MKIEELGSRMESISRKKLRVAAYARVSLDDDVMLNSLNNQVQTYTEYIKANPDWEFVSVYEDRGISGTKEKRPQFQQMLSDCRAGKIDLILTKSFTRFARNTVVLLKTLRELKDLGIEVWFEKDNIRSLHESGELLITLLAAFAQAEAQSASENQLWRIKKNFEEGRPMWARTYGFRQENREYKIIPEEAKIVRMIYDDFLSGMTYSEIARKLNKGHVPSCMGTLWNQRSVSNILKNEKYAGHLLLQKTFTEDYITKKQIKNTGERKQYYVENAHEAIIPQDIFDAAQAERKHRHPGRKKEKPPDSPLSDIVICGSCCSRCICLTAVTGRGLKIRTWLCPSCFAAGRGECMCLPIPETVLIKRTANLLGERRLRKSVRTKLKYVVLLDPGFLLYHFKDGSETVSAWNASCWKNLYGAAYPDNEIKEEEVI
ncbi:recombinase family protein [Enterocloster clostridioformis]|uniref:recombinase family protein n=1 Tax=Enterocloster clostridioformis TaxID=1531 RepID=UPI0008EEFB6C|nr:recombinase family protein [Enterocloster clostridioformis]SFG86423.1 Site-specific DNA recombinase [Enterocloster clostridioformis]